MKQQVLEAKLARIEAVARAALTGDAKASALLTIIQIAEKERSLV